MLQTLTRQATDVLFESPGRIGYRSRELPPLKDGEFLVKTLYSGISAGTELTELQGSSPKLGEGWDRQLMLFRPEVKPDPIDNFPMLKGYMNVGEVIESRNPKAKAGMIIAGELAWGWGHTSLHIVPAEEVWIQLPSGVDPITGIWASKMGPICMEGVLYAADDLQRRELTTLKGSLKDQRVVVFGAGMIGLLTGLFAQWAGATEVGIVDGIGERLKAARSLGLKPFPAGTDLPVRVKTHWQTADPRDTGADIAFQCTGSDLLLDQAFSCLREQGTVVDMGFYPAGAGNLRLSREFHHNRLRHICGQIGAEPRHQRRLWNRARLAAETVAYLQAHGASMRRHLITHIVPFSRAQEAYDRLADRDTSMLQVVLQPD